MNNHWHPTPEDAHRAVELVSQGKCATQIAHALFPLIGSKKEKKQQLHRNIMRVKSLLNFARETGIMILRSETNTELQTALPLNAKIHVVHAGPRGQQPHDHVEHESDSRDEGDLPVRP